MEPKVSFSLEAYQKLKLYAEHATGEISGLGKIRKEEMRIVVEDIILLEQEAGHTSTIISLDGMAKVMDKLLEDGEDMPRCWWHSHANMEVFWSGTDIATIASLDNLQEEDNWWLSVEINKKGEIKARIDVFSPFPGTFDDLDWDIEYGNEELEKAIIDEIEEKVKKPEKIMNYFENKKKNKKNKNWRKKMKRFKQNGSDDRHWRNDGATLCVYCHQGGMLWKDEYHGYLCKKCKTDCERLEKDRAKIEAEREDYEA